MSDTDPLIARLPVVLLPGWRHWRDTHMYAQWRVQHNLRTGAWRLAAPTGRTWRAPTERACLDMLAERRARGLRWPSAHLVLLIPGLNGVPVSFWRMQRALREAGYAAMVWNYPSNRADVRGHAQALRALLDGLEGAERLSFVTHSMGGLILRALLADGPPGAIAPGRVVMIAPPHGGSFVADLAAETLKWDAMFAWVAGRARHNLTSAGAAALPPLAAPVGIIAGGTGWGRLGFSPLHWGDNDWLVSVKSCRLESAADFVQVRGVSHTLMLWGRRTTRHVLSFLDTGHFARD
jgi:hypothetical protein